MMLDAYELTTNLQILLALVCGVFVHWTTTKIGKEEGQEHPYIWQYSIAAGVLCMLVLSGVDVPGGFFLAGLIMVLITIAFVDMQTGYIPVSLNLVAMGWAAYAVVRTQGLVVNDYLTSLAVFAGILAFPLIVHGILKRKLFMGLGDLLLLPSLALLVSPQLAPLALLIAVVAIAITQKLPEKYRFSRYADDSEEDPKLRFQAPFGPSLVAGTLICLYWQDELIAGPMRSLYALVGQLV